MKHAIESIAVDNRPVCAIAGERQLIQDIQIPGGARILIASGEQIFRAISVGIYVW
jgi:hypothetical protein